MAPKSKKNDKTPPIKVDPPKEEPAKVNPPKEEPTKVDPPKEEPTKVDPPKEEPTKVDPPKEEPTKVDPQKKESAQVKKSTSYRKVADSYAIIYPGNKVFHITTDMQVFLEKNKSAAINHQKTLGEGQVQTINID